MNYLDDFKQAMQAAGIDPPAELLADGTLQRYSSGGDRSKNSWYILFADDPAAGKFGCWKRGISETWCSKGYSSPPAACYRGARGLLPCGSLTSPSYREQFR